MSKPKRDATGLQIRSARRMSILALMALVGIALSALLFDQAATARSQAFAAPVKASSEPWLELNCLESVVEEGDDFRLIVNKKFDSDWPHEKIRVFWYTDPITADESDYERLNAEGQASNGYQSKHGRMGRDFHTREDDYPEIDETFIVRFNNSNDKGHDGQCVITITDDDGVGIYNLEITSTPHDIPATGNQPARVGYAAGDVIEITAYFTGDVTTINPATGQQSDYAGIYIQVGENRRYAPFLRNYGADALVFGYTVRPDDRDTDGISVKDGGPGTGLGYDPDHQNRGIWITENGSSSINRLFHGLDDDPGHKVYELDIEEPMIVDPPLPPGPTMTPFEQDILADTSSVVFHREQHGELTEADEGRDWFSLEAHAGESYIIELKNRWFVKEPSPEGSSWGFQYIDGHLIDPSILEIVDKDGNQVLGEQDWGGFTGLFARAFFNPVEDGTYYVAIGAGAQDRGGLGHYTISFRVDDHADDYRANPAVVIRPGESITATIDSDVAPDDPGLNPWDWLETAGGAAVPIQGDESPDDRDVFRLEIAEAGTYMVSVIDGPDSVGIWSVMSATGTALKYERTAPVEAMSIHFEPGAYLAEIGTPYRSEGNTGSYTLTLEAVGG